MPLKKVNEKNSRWCSTSMLAPGARIVKDLSLFLLATSEGAYLTLIPENEGLFPALEEMVKLSVGIFESA